MQEHILKVIKQVEIDYEVKVLFACESGSRAWGYSSAESDFDVRFIYIHKTNWYLSIDDKRDVLEISKQDSISTETHPLLDVSGWELRKALKLLRKSNPTLLEWIHTDIVYYKAYSTINKMKMLSSNLFDPIPCLFHYLNMAKRNISAFLQGNMVKIKHYFNILRPILAAKWIEKYHSIPPVQFELLLEETVPEGELKEYIYFLMKRKKAGEELDLEPRLDFLRRYLNDEMNRIEAFARNLNKKMPAPTNQLDQLFRETLEEAWKQSLKKSRGKVN